MYSCSLLRNTRNLAILNKSFERTLNCWTAAITRKHRQVYARTYPSLLVLPDGSSIHVEYDEPRKIIVLPLNIAELSVSEQKRRLEKRKPKSKVILTDEIEDDFDESKYFNIGDR